MAYPLMPITTKASDLEQLGTKEKFWFFREEEEIKSWLFKFSRTGTGEHWSEKCAEQICDRLGIPHARYELADTDSRHGIMTPNLIPAGYRMVMGNEVLHNTTAGYPRPLSFDEKAVRVKEHTVTRVLGCLHSEGILPPSGPWKLSGLDAADVFCGYLMLDALISNQDRHHENWAIMLNNATGDKYLCPTYDHAASLGREMTDMDRLSRLRTKDHNRQIPAFVSKARSELFRLKSDKKPLLTLEAFKHAVEYRPAAKAFWLKKLRALNKECIIDIFQQVPHSFMHE